MAFTVKIRKARESDRAGIESISARTWDGGDYLPRVLDEWLADQSGQFYVALDPANGHRVLGTARLARLGEDEWWLEGLRVDPERYGQGIGRALHHYCIEQAETIGSGVLRLSTSSANQAVQKLVSQTGFAVAGQYALYRADSIASGLYASEFQALEPSDLPAVRNFLDCSPYYQHADRSMVQSWKWTFITDERLRSRLAESLIYGWYGPAMDQQALAGVLILNPPGEPQPGKIPMLSVAYLDANEGYLATMALAVRGLAVKLGYRRLQLRFVTLPVRLVAMEQAGWRTVLHNERIFLFSRQLGQASVQR